MPKERLLTYGAIPSPLDTRWYLEFYTFAGCWYGGEVDTGITRARVETVPAAKRFHVKGYTFFAQNLVHGE